MVEFRREGRLNKKLIILISILIPIVLVTVYILFTKEQAKKSIYNYISKQGITEKQLKYVDFKKDYKRGGYNLFTYVNDEKENIHYVYHYQDRKVTFSAYLNDPDYIKEKAWGGSRLTAEELSTLKHPPLK